MTIIKTNNNKIKIRRGSKQEDYILYEVLGSGGFGTCYRGINKRTNIVYCVKKINRTSKKEAALQSFRAETREELFAFEHSNIVKLLSASIVTNNDFFYTKFEQLVMVFEFIEGQNLQRLLEDETEIIDQQRMCRFGHDIASALDYIHQRGIVHLDIKPANIMVTSRNDVCKVADFGCCQYNDSDPVHSESLLTGTFAYRAPELHCGLPPTPLCDVYALGKNICLGRQNPRDFVIAKL